MSGPALDELGRAVLQQMTPPQRLALVQLAYDDYGVELAAELKRLLDENTEAIVSRTINQMNATPKWDTGVKVTPGSRKHLRYDPATQTTVPVKS
jgi:hypothetical protein